MQGEIMKILKILGYVVLTVFAVSCGDSSKDQSDREFKQDVRLISYLLKNAKVQVDLKSPSGSVDEIDKVLNYAPDESKDTVERVIENSDFVLKVNGQKANIKISSNGNVEYRQVFEKSSPGCALRGLSTVTGEATALKLELNWKLEMQLNGDSCSQGIRDDFAGFVTTEVESLHLQSVKDLIGAADRDISAAQQVKVELQLRGEGR